MPQRASPSPESAVRHDLADKVISKYVDTSLRITTRSLTLLANMSASYRILMLSALDSCCITRGVQLLTRRSRLDAVDARASTV